MTVKELITLLSRIKDKTLSVEVNYLDEGITADVISVSEVKSYDLENASRNSPTVLLGVAE